MMTTFDNDTHYGVFMTGTGLDSMERIRASELALKALKQVGVLSTLEIGISAPGDNSKLWLDKSTDPDELKYHNGSSWVGITTEKFAEHLYTVSGLEATSFNWQGSWSSVIEYVANDVVANSPDGSTRAYICTATNTNKEPGVAADWENYWGLMIEGGADGADGANGSNGTDGTDGATIIYQASEPATSYAADSLWIDSDSSGVKVYRLVSSVWQDTGITLQGQDGADGTNGTDGTLENVYQGAWQTATAYSVSDVVTESGSAYICTGGHTSGASNQPGSGGSWATVWDVLASKGSDGAGGDMFNADNLSGLTNTATARGNLGVAIGTDVQAYDANLPTWPATVDATEVGYLNGVTSAIQTQIDGKAATSHAHATTDITSGTFADARIAESNVTQHEAAISITESQISDLGTYETADADILKADTADVLTAGFATTPHNLGNSTGATVTPDEANGNIQFISNNGAWTLNPPTNNCTIIIQMSNVSGAGGITSSSFDKVEDTDLTTADGDDFFLYITKANGFSELYVRGVLVA
jgi:hypothetical protein